MLRPCWSRLSQNFELDHYKNSVNLSEMTRLEAEVYFISFGLSHIQNSWEPLVDLFHRRLQEEQNFILSPAKHDELFFDDAVFARSRRYFWTIDTLTQIESFITDNIYQCTGYRKGNIEWMANDHQNMPEIGWLWLADRNCSMLIRQRDLFRSYLASFQSLRDGVNTFSQPQ